MSCTRRCEGCAFSEGARANEEPQNRFRGIFSALGGYAFFCHESLGWDRDRDGYPDGSGVTVLEILTLRHSLEKAGIATGNLTAKYNDARVRMRPCGGWTEAVRRLKAAGWFDQPEVRRIRSHFARTGAHALEQDESGNISVNGVKQSLDWLLAELGEAGIDAEFLIGAPASEK
jgi:hypothetical protein